MEWRRGRGINRGGRGLTRDRERSGKMSVRPSVQGHRARVWIFWGESFGREGDLLREGLGLVLGTDLMEE